MFDRYLCLNKKYWVSKVYKEKLLDQQKLLDAKRFLGPTEILCQKKIGSKMIFGSNKGPSSIMQILVDFVNYMIRKLRICVLLQKNKNVSHFTHVWVKRNAWRRRKKEEREREQKVCVDVGQLATLAHDNYAGRTQATKSRSVCQMYANWVKKIYVRSNATEQLRKICQNSAIWIGWLSFGTLFG